jgi:septal ring factor EnvC (AmiA/AmiB activator)
MGLLILVFVLGVAIGAAGITIFNTRVYGDLRKPPQQQASTTTRTVARINQDLNLSADQQKQLAQILDSMQAGYNNIRQQMTPQFEQVRQQGREQIRQILTGDQRPKFEEYLQKVDEERRRRLAASGKPNS